jgi:hypothetical protein
MDWLRTHRGLVGIIVVTTLLGALGGAVLFDDWSLARRMAAGAVLGAGSALILTANRLIAT